MKLEHWLTVICALAIILIIHLIRKSTQRKFTKIVSAHNMEELEAFCQKKVARYSIPPFNMEYAKMTVYLLNGDEKKAIEQFDYLLDMRKTKSQDLEITMQAFRYFIGIKDKERSKKMYEKICELGNETQVHESTIMYDVYVMDKYNHIDEILTRYEECGEGGEIIYAKMLSMMYKNKGDKENAKYYLDVAEGRKKRSKKKKALSETENIE